MVKEGSHTLYDSGRTSNCSKCNKIIAIRNTLKKFCDDCLNENNRKSQYEYCLRNKEKTKEAYRKNKQKILERVKKYSVLNKEKKTKYHKKWYEKNKEKVLQKAKEWGNAHKEKKREIGRSWNRAHREYTRESAKKRYRLIKGTEKFKFNMLLCRQRREARLNNVIHNFTIGQWRQKVRLTRGICPGCNVYIGTDKLTLDHIYPISKANEDFLKTGIKRVYTIEDIQPLCLSCNSSKRTSIPKELLANSPSK